MVTNRISYLPITFIEYFKNTLDQIFVQGCKKIQRTNNCTLQNTLMAQSNDGIPRENKLTHGALWSLSNSLMDRKSAAAAIFDGRYVTNVYSISVSSIRYFASVCCSGSTCKE